jgi:NadR type nicotinamide-nucleotide adenylyltransferase
MQGLKKIVLIGPESTGKSFLSAALAKHYQTTWVPEYARTFLNEHDKKYTYPDLLTIAKGQLAAEDAIVQTDSNKLVFIDTDMYVMKVWSEFVFGKCEPFILEQIASRQYDHYLLCNTDLPWVKDELREYPDLQIRESLFTIYKEHLINQNTSWTEIKGTGEQRIQNAINAIDQLLVSA